MANKFLNDTGLSTLWAKVDDKFVRKDAFNTALSGKSDVGHAHDNYLPLSGGTLSGNILLGNGNAILGSGNSIPTKFKDSAEINPEVHSIWLAAVGTGSNGTAGTEASGILFDGNTIKMWSPLDNNPLIIDSDSGTAHTLLHSGNISGWALTSLPTHTHTKSEITDFPASLPANGGNADTVDGYHATCDINKPWGTIPVITTSGWMDVGKQFEFHFDNTADSDYSTILLCTGNHSNVVNLPSASGTLALLTDNVASAYKLVTSTGADAVTTDGYLVKTSSSLSVGTLLNINRHTNTGALFDSSKMGFEIEPFASYVTLRGYNTSGTGVGGLNLNSSGNVGIGTTNPAYKLDVNGSPRFGNGSSCDVWLNRTSGNSYINAVDTLALTTGNDSGNIALVIGTDRSTVFTGNIYSDTKDAYLMFNRGNEGIYMHGGGINWHASDNVWASSLIGFEQNLIKLQKFTNISGQLFTQYSTNNATIVPESSSLIIGHSPNKAGHTGYHTGIGFNALCYGSYLNHNHAWIGLGKYTTTTTAECYPLVFATNESTTTNTSPIERMSIAPNGDVTIKKNLTVDGTITGNVTGNVTGNCSGSATTATYATTAGSAPASDVYAWAKAASKPSYNFGEIGAGIATIGDGANRIMFRTNASYKNGIYYSTPGNEALVFGTVNPVTSWIFATTDPTTQTDWTELTPSLQIKNGCVCINKLIAHGSNASYNLDVNGSANATTLYENGTRVALSGHTHTKVDITDFPTSLPASDVYAWAKAASKPTYTASEVGAAASNHTHNYFAENTPLYLREPSNTSWRGGIYWGSAGNECLSFVTVNANTTFKFVCGSDIANWANNTWQSTTGTLNISNTGITINGTTSSSGGFYESSDERIKDFEEDIQVDFQKLKNLKKKYFKFKGSDKLNLGVSAQEIQSIYPEIVIEDENGILQVDYAKLSVIALKAIDTMYDNFENRISQLEQLIKSK